MHIFRTLGVAAAVLTIGAGAAMAWGDTYMGDHKTDQSQLPVFAYPGVANNCPAGLQPVRIGGAICCGTPTAEGTGQPRAATRAHPVRAYAPVGEKGVVYR